jgi:hypothetical protein
MTPMMWPPLPGLPGDRPARHAVASGQLTGPAPVPDPHVYDRSRLPKSALGGLRARLPDGTRPAAGGARDARAGVQQIRRLVSGSRRTSFLSAKSFAKISEIRQLP